MSMDWEKVTCCPYCGGPLEISEHYIFSLDRKITKSGVVSKKARKSAPEFADCITGFCLECARPFDGNEITVESDGSVWVRVKKGMFSHD